VFSVSSSAAGGKNILLGIGNIDRGDDGVGPYIATHFTNPDWLCFDVGTAPENFTGVVRKHHPEQLVLIDAADMGLPPGAIRRVPRELIQDVGFGTHMLPLYHVIDYLKGAVQEEIILIGIQPASKDYGAPMSNEAENAAKELIQLLTSGAWSDIPSLPKSS
jgi:hydrogenase 3 maturation protease